MSMAKFFLQQAVRLILLLFAACVITFVLISFSPIDPVQAYIGADLMRVGSEQREAIAEYWGLNDPPVQRFWAWFGALLRGDFGTSLIYRAPVLDVIGDRFLNSLALMMVAWVLSGVIGYAAGAAAAMHPQSRLDRFIQWYCYTLAATPAFWAGLLLLVVFTVWIPLFPVGLGVPAGATAEEVTWLDRLHHMILPALTLSITGISAAALHTREKAAEVLNSEYVLYARARGEEGLTLFLRRGLRHTLIPAVTLQFSSFSELFGGAVLVEQVFSYPGLGQATVEAAVRGDVPLLMGIVLFSTLFVFTGNLFSELLYQWIDPRIRAGRQP